MYVNKKYMYIQTYNQMMKETKMKYRFDESGTIHDPLDEFEKIHNDRLDPLEESFNEAVENISDSMHELKKISYELNARKQATFENAKLALNILFEETLHDLVCAYGDELDKEGK